MVILTSLIAAMGLNHHITELTHLENFCRDLAEESRVPDEVVAEQNRLKLRS